MPLLSRPVPLKSSKSSRSAACPPSTKRQKLVKPVTKPGVSVLDLPDDTDGAGSLSGSSTAFECECKSMALEDFDVPSAQIKESASAAPSINDDDIVSLSDSVVSCFCHHGEPMPIISRCPDTYFCNGCSNEGPSNEDWVECPSRTHECGKTYCKTCDQRWINFQ